MNILVVEDDPIVRSLMKQFLKGDGWTVFEAENGAVGLTMLKDAAIDIILSDVYMPVMDGLKFFKAIRAVPEYEKLPFLFMSGYDDELTRMAIQSSANAGFWKKGKEMNELKAWLKFLITPAEKRKGRSPFT
ncbi:MAG: response regulator [Ignavibacteriae bacterium]|nr:response regulator [Ignavibacteria bacterium]MBI3363279.1 response regulator [Ignavibacteriota bacterium]